MGTESPSATPADRLIGRDRQVELVRRFLHAAAHGGDYLEFSGGPGLGKSALLTAAAEAAAPESIVLRASGVQYESEMSFATINQLMIPLHTAMKHYPISVREPL